MKMQYTYGIFDDEADHILEMVRRHAPLEQVRGGKCPACGSAMSVEFSEDGTSYLIYCAGKPLHMSKYQDIVNPPPWWRECVSEPTDCVWYWREWHSFDRRGNLTMKISGWDADGVRWSGQLECAPDDPDYAFWRWLLLQSGCTSDLIGNEELAELRVQYAKITHQPAESDRPHIQR